MSPAIWHNYAGSVVTNGIQVRAFTGGCGGIGPYAGYGADQVERGITLLG
jgi:hypothetical protein